MRGLIVECEDDKEFAIVDTRSDQHGRLHLYHGEPASTLAVGMTVDFELKVSGAGNTYAKLTSVIERNQALFSTEDRAQWYEWGEDAEADFVEKIVPQLGLDIRKNPEKERCSWAIDLFDYTNDRPADLKVQNTPFFTVAKYRYCGRTSRATRPTTRTASSTSGCTGRSGSTATSPSPSFTASGGRSSRSSASASSAARPRFTRIKTDRPTTTTRGTATCSP